MKDAEIERRVVSDTQNDSLQQDLAFAAFERERRLAWLRKELAVRMWPNELTPPDPRALEAAARERYEFEQRLIQGSE